MIETEYLEGLSHTELSEFLAKAIFKISPYKESFDAIAFTGISGALMAPLLAISLKKDLIVVRKNNDDCHSDDMVEGAIDARSYLIVDDGIYSGQTLRTIVRQIGKVSRAKCAGVLCYNTASCNGGQFYSEPSMMKNWFRDDVWP